MLRYEASLPRLPVPALEETATRYLNSVRPLLSNDEYQKTKSAVEAFTAPGSLGRELQKRLLQRRDDPRVKNWLAAWWNELAYLAYRDPVVPYVSYFYSHRDDRSRRDPAKRAAALTTAVLEFKKWVDEGTLEPEYMKNVPIAMESYRWMFNACRIPGEKVDYPEKYDYRQHKHIVVVRKNQFFKVEHEMGGRPLTTAELEAQFRRIYATATSAPALGALTAAPRDHWAKARRALLSANPANAAALEAIQSAAFVVCLDDAAPVTLAERAHQYWHGDGRNRWFDKPCQIIVNDNGTSGFMGEHSMMDGTPTHRLNDTALAMIFGNKLDFSNPSVRSSLPDPPPLSFTLNKQVHSHIGRAASDFDTLIAQHELAVQAYQGYGKALIKKFGCSPDAYVQMVIQLAYRKMYGRNRPTYESAATRRFQQGRTETCRSVSVESVRWCEAMSSPDVGAEECAELFKKALGAQSKYIVDASAGKGVDRHLLGLKMCLREGEELPELYRDPAYAYSSTWYLSTSQLSSEYFNGYGWSQVIDDGFGIAYMINENRYVLLSRVICLSVEFIADGWWCSIQFNIVSKRLGSERMSFYLNEAAGDIRDMLLPTLEKPKPKL